MGYILLFTNVVLISVSDSVSALTTLTPSTLEIIEGESGNLTCKGDSPVNFTRWGMYLLGRISSAVTFFNGSCFSSGFLNNTSDYQVYCESDFVHTVLIKNISGSSHGQQWDCIRYFYTSSVSTIVVIVPVKSVHVQPGQIISAKENSSIFLSCTTSYARPRPNVTWFLSDGRTDTIFDVDETVSYTNDSDGLYLTRSYITYIAKRYHNGLYLYCTATNYATTTVLSEKVQLDIKYPPSSPQLMDVKTNGSKNIYTVIETRSGHLICSVLDGNPQPTLTWDCFQDQSETLRNSTHVSVEINWIASRDQSRTCTCTSQQVFIGTESVLVFIEVLYTAKVMSFEIKGHEGRDTVIATQNDTIQFMCLIDAAAVDAKLLFKWDNILKEEVNATSIQYTINKVTCEDSGFYSCVGNNEYNAMLPSTKHLAVFVKCPPKISKTFDVQDTASASLGQTVTFRLSVVAFPKPDESSFVWMRTTGSGLVTVNNTRHTAISSNGLDTNLTITEITHDDFGQYQVSVENELGKLVQLFTLQTVGVTESNVASVAVGSTLGVLAVVGVIVVIVFVTRRNRNTKTMNCLGKCPTRSAMRNMKREQEDQVNTAEATVSDSANTYETIRNESHELFQTLENRVLHKGVGTVANLITASELPQSYHNDKEYQQITLSEDESKVVYKNVQLTQPSART